MHRLLIAALPCEQSLCIGEQREQRRPGPAPRRVLPHGGATLRRRVQPGDQASRQTRPTCTISTSKIPSAIRIHWIVEPVGARSCPGDRFEERHEAIPPATRPAVCSQFGGVSGGLILDRQRRGVPGYHRLGGLPRGFRPLLCHSGLPLSRLSLQASREGRWQANRKVPLCPVLIRERSSLAGNCQEFARSFAVERPVPPSNDRTADRPARLRRRQ